MRTRRVIAALLLFSASTLRAGDWPTYMHDARRGGVSAEEMALPLAEHWTLRAPLVPRPAWPLPQEGWTELPKVNFDDAYYAIADEERVYFGSSGGNQVCAVDAKTGRVRWKFFTSGPVRLAPTLAGGRLYFGCDDGKVYCVGRTDGTLVWSFDAAPDPRRVLGNGRVTSLWPVRTSVLVEGDRVYFGAGVFPYHKVFMFALDARTGEVAWKNDALAATGGFSPQGYLLASEHGIIVPSGRALPVCLDRKTGQLLFNVPPSTTRGEAAGVYGVIVDHALFVGTQNSLVGTNTKTGGPAGRWLTADRLVATADSFYLLKGPPAPAYGRRSPSGQANDIIAYDRAKHAQLAKKDVEGLKSARRWRLPRADVESMIVAGKHLIAGGRDEIVIADRMTGAVLETHKVDGLAVGLAFAHGRLLVSTTRGTTHCFAAGTTPTQLTGPPLVARDPKVQARAAGILKKADVAKGYALVHGPGATELAEELARQSDLSVTALESDAAKRATARKRLDDTGLHGQRVAVEPGEPDKIPFPDYAANLIVQTGADGLSEREWTRCLKPSGGVALGSQTSSAFPQSTERETQSVDINGETWQMHIRGNLKGSGWWTHQFADAGNSGSSGDQRIKGRLDVLWFGEPGPDEFPDRHQRGEAPLVMNGRVFCEGWNFLEKKHSIFCFDAYNGVRYWKREVEGAVRLGLPSVAGNLVCNEDSVFVAAGSKCHRLDARTGETKAVYETPGTDDERPNWSYLAVENGVLIGSAEKPGWARFSDVVFGIDLKTDRVLWTHRAKEIRDTTLSLSGGRVFFADNRKDPPAKGLKLIDPSLAGPMLRTVVALDVKTGTPAWEKEVDLADCGRWEQGVWGTIQSLARGDVLVFAGAYTIYNGGKGTGPSPHRALALSTRDGQTLWSEVVANRSRPIMMKDALLAEPLFYDVHKGTKILKKQGNKMAPWTMGPRTGGCGSLSACDSMVFGRGGYTVWRDVDTGPGGAFIGMRPGCFINIIPAGGVVVQAEASSGCTCYQAIQCTVVFRPRERDEGP